MVSFDKGRRYGGISTWEQPATTPAAATATAKAIQRLTEVLNSRPTLRNTPQAHSVSSESVNK